MGRWFVTLSGDNFDLEALLTHFTQPELLVQKDDERFLLSSTEFDESADGEMLRNQARTLVELMNGALYLIDPGHRPVAEGGVEFRRDDGTREIFVLGSFSARSRMSATLTVEGEPVVTPMPTAAMARVQVSRFNPSIAAVLRDLASTEPDFAALHRVLETIELDVGDETQVVHRGWASASELKLFSRTANTTGLRHAAGKYDPPSRPMQLHEARDLARRVATSWLRDVYGIS